MLPLRSAPALNTLLITLMLGTVLREAVRLFYPQGANPKPFPALLPASSINFGNFNLRLDNAIMLAAGVLVIVGLHLLLNRTKLGLAIRAVAQDEETARTMGVNFTAIVLVTFAIGSGLAAFAGIMNGLYYNEINFGMGLCSASSALPPPSSAGSAASMAPSSAASCSPRCRPSAPWRCRSPAPTRTCSPSRS